MRRALESRANEREAKDGSGGAKKGPTLDLTRNHISAAKAVSEASQTTPAMVFARQKFGATLQSMAPQQTQRFTTAPSVVSRSGS